MDYVLFIYYFPFLLESSFLTIYFYKKEIQLVPFNLSFTSKKFLCPSGFLYTKRLFPHLMKQLSINLYIEYPCTVQGNDLEVKRWCKRATLRLEVAHKG